MKNKTTLGALAVVGVIGRKEDPVKYLQRLLPNVTVGKSKLFDDDYYSFTSKISNSRIDMLSSLGLDEIIQSVTLCFGH